MTNVVCPCCEMSFELKVADDPEVDPLTKARFSGYMAGLNGQGLVAAPQISDTRRDAFVQVRQHWIIGHDAGAVVRKRKTG